MLAQASTRCDVITNHAAVHCRYVRQGHFAGPVFGRVYVRVLAGQPATRPEHAVMNVLAACNLR